MTAIRKNAVPFFTLLGLIAVALAVGAYILAQQGARFPLLSEQPVRMHAELDTVQGVTPGQGQTVQVAGVQIGKIANVRLVDGHARMDLDIKKRYADDGLIRANAHALLRPRTPLKDMYLQVFPGDWSRPAAKKGFEIPLQNTLPDVNLDEILAQLDSRTRDYLTLLIKGTGEGLRGRGADLADVFRRFGPTVRDLGRVNRAVANERTSLRKVVSSLSGLSGRLARRPQDLSGLVSAANATFGAFASEDSRLRDTVALLPGTLRQATQTLHDVRPLADELGPTTRALTPTVRALDIANGRVQPFAREAAPIIRRQIRPFTRAARPVVRDLAPASADLAATFPELTRSGTVLNHLVNMLGYNQNGREAPQVSGRDEGYLFWLAWTAHQGTNLQNVDDANGPIRPVFLTGTCATLTGLVQRQPGLEFGMGLSPLLAGLCGNPTTASVQPAKALAKPDGRP